MTLQYFIEKSENIKLISPAFTILSDLTFIDFFKQIIKQQDIKEYYLMDSNGSFLLIDKNDKKSVLYLTTDNDLDEFIGFYQDEPLIQIYLNQVRSRKVVPFFGIGVNPFDIPLENWKDLFFNTEALTIQNKQYYWSICAC